MRKPELVSLNAEDNLLCVIGARLLDEFGEKYEIDHDPQKHSNVISFLDSKGGIRREAQGMSFSHPLSCRRGDFSANFRLAFVQLGRGRD